MNLLHLDLETVAWRCSVKKVFVQFLRNSQENRDKRDQKKTGSNIFKKVVKYN